MKSIPTSTFLPWICTASALCVAQTCALRAGHCPRELMSSRRALSLLERWCPSCLYEPETPGVGFSIGLVLENRQYCTPLLRRHRGSLHMCRCDRVWYVRCVVPYSIGHVRKVCRQSLWWLTVNGMCLGCDEKHALKNSAEQAESGKSPQESDKNSDEDEQIEVRVRHSCGFGRFRADFTQKYILYIFRVYDSNGRFAPYLKRNIYYIYLYSI